MKLKINNETLVEEFFECTRIVGIMASLKDYQFIWNINRQLEFNFRVNHSLEIQLKKKERIYYFSVYEYVVPSCCMIHYLYNNQFDGEYLLPEFKHLDFLWLMKGDDVSNDSMSSVMQLIKPLPTVQLATEMSLEKIKNKQHLIL